MFYNRLIKFLTENLFGEKIICKYNNLICYGETKIFTEIISTIILICVVFVVLNILFILFDNLVEDREYLNRIINLFLIVGLSNMLLFTIIGL